MTIFEVFGRSLGISHTDYCRYFQISRRVWVRQPLETGKLSKEVVKNYSNPYQGLF